MIIEIEQTWKKLVVILSGATMIASFAFFLYTLDAKASRAQKKANDADKIAKSADALAKTNMIRIEGNDRMFETLIAMGGFTADDARKFSKIPRAPKKDSAGNTIPAQEWVITDGEVPPAMLLHYKVDDSGNVSVDTLVPPETKD